MDGPARPPGIEVGETPAEGLRLWLAGETVRQAEQRLTGQLSSVQSMEARATSLLSWSGAALVALAYGTHAPTAYTTLAGVCLLGCVGACIAASLPAGWRYPGYAPSELIAWNLQSRLEIAEKTAAGLEAAELANAARIARLSRRLRVAWFAFGAAALFEAASLIKPLF